MSSLQATGEPSPLRLEKFVLRVLYIPQKFTKIAVSRAQKKLHSELKHRCRAAVFEGNHFAPSGLARPPSAGTALNFAAGLDCNACMRKLPSCRIYEISNASQRAQLTYALILSRKCHGTQSDCRL